MTREISRGLRWFLGLAGLVALPLTGLLLIYGPPAFGESPMFGVVVFGGGLGGGLFLVVSWKAARSGRASRRGVVVALVGGAALIIGLRAFATAFNRTLTEELLSLPRAGLVRFAETQRAYYVQHGTYTTDLSLLDSALWRPPPRIVFAVTRADSAGWRGTARYEQRDDLACSLAVWGDSLHAGVPFHDAVEARISCDR